MKTISTLLLATFALAALSADHTTDAVNVHSNANHHLTHKQAAAIKQRLADSHEKSHTHEQLHHAKPHVAVKKPIVQAKKAHAKTPTLVKKLTAKAVGMEGSGSGMHLMDGDGGWDTGSGSDASSGSGVVEESSNSGDDSGDSDGSNIAHYEHGLAMEEDHDFVVSDFFKKDSSTSGSDDGSGSGLDGSNGAGSNAPGANDGSLDGGLGATTTEPPIGGVQGFDEPDEGDEGESTTKKKKRATPRAHKMTVAKHTVAHSKVKVKKEEVVKKHGVATKKKEAKKHDTKKHAAKAKKHDTKKHEAKAKKHESKKHDAKNKKHDNHKKKDDLRKASPTTVNQKYADNALENEAQKAGAAIVSRLSADASPFGIEGANMLQYVGAIAGAVVGVLGLVVAVVRVRRQQSHAGFGQSALVSELPEPQSGRPDRSVEPLTSSGVDLDADEDDEFSDSDDQEDEQDDEEEGAFANTNASAAHIV